MPRPLCALLLLALFVHPAVAEELLPLAVQGGRCDFVVPTANADDQFLLVLGATAQTGGPFRVQLTTAATTDAEVLPLEKRVLDPAWQKHIQYLAARQAESREQRRQA